MAGPDEARIAADLAETEEGLENIEALGVELAGAFNTEEKRAGAFEFGVVEAALIALEFDDEFFLDPWGEILGDLRLGPSEEKMFYTVGEALVGASGVLFIIVEAFEGSLAAEEAGLGEGEEAPEIEEAIFDGSAGEDEALACTEGAGRLGGGTRGVFDVLAFVENYGVPGFAGEGLGVQPQLGIVGDEKMGFECGEWGGGRLGGGWAGGEVGDEVGGEASGGEGGGEAGGLELPVDDDGLGADDEGAERAVGRAGG